MLKCRSIIQKEANMYKLIIRWIDGRITTVLTDSIHRALSIKTKKQSLHGDLIVWSIYKNNQKIKQGWS